MSSHFIVAEGCEFDYPANLKSEQLIKNFGGRSHMTPAQHQQVQYKTVKEGQNCDDLPKGVLALYLSRGWVIEKEDLKPVPVVEKIEEKKEGL